jgi:hypothetical protein
VLSIECACKNDWGRSKARHVRVERYVWISSPNTRFWCAVLTVVSATLLPPVFVKDLAVERERASMIHPR